MSVVLRTFYSGLLDLLRRRQTWTEQTWVMPVYRAWPRTLSVGIPRARGSTGSILSSFSLMWALTPSLGYEYRLPLISIPGLDLVYGSCYPPCQTRPSTALVGLRGYRVGSLLHTYGWFFIFVSKYGHLTLRNRICSQLRPIRLDSWRLG